MSAQAIIERAKVAGLALSISDKGGLKFAGDARAVELMRPELIAHKAEILKLLGMTASNCDLAHVRQTLERFAIEQGFTWPDLLDAGLIVESDLDQFAQDWSSYSVTEWRAYIASIGARARHGCPGLAHRVVCDCGGQCRAFGAQP